MKFKSGRVSDVDVANYEEYVASLEGYCEKGQWPFVRCRVLRMERYEMFETLVVVTSFLQKFWGIWFEFKKGTAKHKQKICSGHSARQDS